MVLIDYVGHGDMIHPEKYQHSLKGYYRMISGIDLEIKKIVTNLKKKVKIKIPLSL